MFAVGSSRLNGHEKAPVGHADLDQPPNPTARTKSPEQKFQKGVPIPDCLLFVVALPNFLRTALYMSLSLPGVMFG